MQIKLVFFIDTLDESHFLSISCVAKASTDKPQLTELSQQLCLVATNIPTGLNNLLKVTELVSGLK